MSADGPPIGLGKGNEELTGEVTVLLYALLLRLASLNWGRLVELAADGRRRRSQRLIEGWELALCA